MEKVQAKVLCIDDEQMIRVSIGGYLEDSGYTVILASDGREGLEAFRQHRPDAVLVDLRMPEVDGLEVLAAVRAESPGTPVIVISGTGVIADVIEALRLGAWHYLTKPLEDMVVLEHELEQALEKSRLLSENEEYKRNLEEKVRQRTIDLEKANDQLIVTLNHLEKEIDERKKTEEILRKYEGIISTTNDLMALIADDFSFQAVNPAYLDIHAVAAEEILGKTVAEVYGRRFFEANLKPFMARCLDGEKVDTYAWITFSNSERRLLHISYYPYFDKDGRVTGIVENTRDSTSRKKLEEQLQQAQKMEAIGTLAGGIAHDFNNILGAIMGYTEMLAWDIPDSSSLQKKIQQILKASDRAKELVQQILSFSRQHNQERKPVQIQLIIKEALKLLKASLPSTIEIRQQIKTQRSTILANPTQIHQVLMNLCTNAHHAMRETGGVLTVELYIEEVGEDRAQQYNLSAGRYLVLAVKDTGHGMSVTTKERIFDPYFTTKKKGEGTGLGLSVIHGIIKTHGGAIVVESGVGKGAAFIIFFPMIEDKEDRKPQSVHQPLPTGKECILFVDDEPVLVEIGGQMLRHLGYRVECVADSVEALRLFQQSPDSFDLIITDMTMPKMTGDVLAHEILKVKPTIPIIMATGFSELMTEEKAKRAGIKDFLLKPLVIRDLAGTIRRVLDEREAGRT
ncbi:MAG: response regulator [Desulfobacterales bacterium]|nr:response regulator [Desulfobacterales bacterium]